MTGRKVLHYEIINPIGSGGYGKIYEAIDTKLGRTVAIKFIRPDKVQYPLNLERFASEARLAAALDHPNICSVFDYDFFENIPFIVTQYLKGLTLRQLVNNRPLKLDTVLTIAVQLTDALAYAHSQGVAHRDIKPGNVMITAAGVVKIIDFGVAIQFKGKPSDQTKDLALIKGGEAYGTPTYAAPEQARGEAADHRADIFSAGMLLYEMLTGRWAFHGRSADEVRAKIINETPTPIGLKRRSFVPSRLENIVERAMAKKAEERYQSASVMRDELITIWREVTMDNPIKDVVIARTKAGALLPTQQTSFFQNSLDYLKKLLPAGSPFSTIPKQKFD
jgi:eukaryotic-like serine/threonine-protein kinase